MSPRHFYSFIVLSLLPFLLKSQETVVLDTTIHISTVTSVFILEVKNDDETAVRVNGKAVDGARSFIKNVWKFDQYSHYYELRSEVDTLLRIQLFSKHNITAHSDVELWLKASFDRHVLDSRKFYEQHRIFNYFLVGLLFTLSSLGLLVYWRNRNVLFLFYSLYGMCQWILVVWKDARFISINNQEFHEGFEEVYTHLPDTLQLLSLVFYVLFVYRLLEIRSTKAWVRGFTKSMVVILLGVAILEISVLLGLKNLTIYKSVFNYSSALLFPLFGVLLLVLAINLNHYLKRYFILSTIIFFSVLLISFLTPILPAFDLKIWVDRFFTMPAATALEMLVFGYAIAVKIERENELRVQAERQLLRSETKALRSQMNPHFIFNSLNSIRNYVLNSENEKANSYLIKFSKLLRNTLNYSRETAITLEEELESLKLYIDAEKGRFGDDIDISFNVSDKVDIAFIDIPPLILQPFVENAFHHGLQYSTRTPKKLLVQVNENHGGSIEISIYDNGVGRSGGAKAQSNKKSLGTTITQERMELFNQVYEGNISFKIIDEDVGTRVVILLN